jgi:hypothetical protein
MLLISNFYNRTQEHDVMCNATWCWETISCAMLQGVEIQGVEKQFHEQCYRVLRNTISCAMLQGVEKHNFMCNATGCWETQFHVRCYMVLRNTMSCAMLQSVEIQGVEKHNFMCNATGCWNKYLNILRTLIRIAAKYLMLNFNGNVSNHLKEKNR